MQSRNFAAAAALSVLVAVGCDDPGTLTSPTTEARPVTPGALGLASSHPLVNSDPLCPGARTPGFYCQNQNGKNPNLTAEEFDLLAADAAFVLGTVLGDLTVSEAVCIRGNRAPEDQLVRHLAALALNLAANLIDESTPLIDGSFADVGEAFAAALDVAGNPEATRGERNDVKDVLDAINNNANTELGEECIDEDGEGDGTVEE